MSKMFVKSGDTVVVLSGKSKGVKGEVVAVSPAEGKVIVKKVNVVTKHVKPKKMGEPGGLIEVESALYASKVQLVPESGNGFLGRAAQARDDERIRCRHYGRPAHRRSRDVQ